MNENEIAHVVVDTAFKIHKALGPGLLESAYSAVMAYELRKAGLKTETEAPVDISWDGVKLGVGFRADLVVGDRLVVELKSVEEVRDVHRKQLLTYLRLMDKRLGLLINFGSSLIKDGIWRVVNGLQE